MRNKLPQTPLLTEAGHLSRAARELARSVGLEVNKKTTLAALDKMLQQEWFKKGLLRAEIKGKPATGDQLALARALGMIDEISAPPRQHTTFAGAMIPGAKVTAVRKRLAALVSWWNENTSVDFERNDADGQAVVLLGSMKRLIGPDERELLLQPMEGLPFREGWRAPELPEVITEAQMMQIVFEQTKVPGDSSWRPVLIEATTAEGRHVDFRDTLLSWFGAEPDHDEGPWVLVSGNPFAQYHALVAALTAREAGLEDLVFHLVAYGTDPAKPPTIEVIMDDVAKQVHALAEAARAQNAPRAAS